MVATGRLVVVVVGFTALTTSFRDFVTVPFSFFAVTFTVNFPHVVGVPLAIAAIWVLPVAFVIVYTSRNVMHVVNRRGSRYKVACLDGIQEALETVRDLKAYNAQDTYIRTLPP